MIVVWGRAGTRWLVWGAAVVAYIVAVLGRSSLAATGVTAAERFGVSAGVLSLLAVLQLAVYAALQIPAGVLVDRIGPRRVIAGGAVLGAVGQAVLAVAPVLAVGIAGRVLVGAGDAVTFVSILRLVPSWFPARQVPLVNQLSGILGQLGQIVSAVPLAALVVGAGWTPAYLAAAGTAGLAAVLVVAVVRDGPVAAEGGPPSVGAGRGEVVGAGQRGAAVGGSDADAVSGGGPGAGGAGAGGASVDGPSTGGFREILRSPGTRLAFWCHFASPFAGNAFGLLWGFPFLTAGELLAPGTARGLITVYVLSAIAAGPVYGVLAGRLPDRRPALIASAVVIQIVAWGAVLAWPGPAPLAVLIALSALLGLGQPSSLVAFDVARAWVAPSQVGRACGAVNVGGFTSSLLVVLLVGVALDLQGAGDPAAWSPEAFRVAMLVQAPVWALGLVAMVVASRSARAASRVPVAV